MLTIPKVTDPHVEMPAAQVQYGDWIIHNAGDGDQVWFVNYIVEDTPVRDFYLLNLAAHPFRLTTDGLLKVLK